MTDDSKKWYQSAGVWGGVCTVAFALAGAVGWQVAPADQAQAISYVTGIATGIAGLVALWGRVRATRRIG